MPKPLRTAQKSQSDINNKKREENDRSIAKQLIPRKGIFSSGARIKQRLGKAILLAQSIRDKHKNLNIQETLEADRETNV
jgi:hypothetical protein